MLPVQTEVPLLHRKCTWTDSLSYLLIQYSCATWNYNSDVCRCHCVTGDIWRLNLCQPITSTIFAVSWAYNLYISDTFTISGLNNDNIAYVKYLHLVLFVNTSIILPLWSILSSNARFDYKLCFTPISAGLKNYDKLYPYFP